MRPHNNIHQKFDKMRWMRSNANHSLNFMNLNKLAAFALVTGTAGCTDRDWIEKEEITHVEAHPAPYEDSEFRRSPGEPNNSQFELKTAIYLQKRTVATTLKRAEGELDPATARSLGEKFKCQDYAEHPHIGDTYVFKSILGETQVRVAAVVECVPYSIHGGEGTQTVLMDKQGSVISIIGG